MIPTEIIVLGGVGAGTALAIYRVAASALSTLFWLVVLGTVVAIGMLVGL